jgi:Helicase conserved C-terminal domain
MRYRFTGNQNSLDGRAFCDRAYRRQGMAVWEAKWHDISVGARDAFLNVVKGPVKTSGTNSKRPGVSIKKFARNIVEELTDAGFVEVRVSKSRLSGDRVFTTDGVNNFAARIRTLRRFHLLAAEGPGELAAFVEHAFFGTQLNGVLTTVLHDAGIGGIFYLNDALAKYVTHRRWPEWVARSIDGGQAAWIVDAVHQAGGSLPLAELLDRTKGNHRDADRAAVEKMVTRLGLVEDLRPATWELMVGFLPAVREAIDRARARRDRPPLVVCENPMDIAPDGGALVNDLRAVLLEIATEPPRLRQNQDLFEKEIERFQACLEPMAAWLMMALKWDHPRRLYQALTWARGLRLVEAFSDGKQFRLQLASQGQVWLSANALKQHLRIYDVIRSLGPCQDVDADVKGFTFFGMNPFNRFRPGEVRFFGEYAAVMKVEPGQNVTYFRQATVADELSLRDHFDQALAALKPGVFYRLDSVLSHLAFGRSNPLNRGLAVEDVTVYLSHQQIPALEEERERAGRLLIETFMARRLIPLGCVRAAVDGEKRLCIARLPYYDAYFGREVDQTSVAPILATAAKVVVQPDFSVMVIGLNPAPVAELAPFCERTTRGNGQGASILKITRESVVKAVSNGMKPEEIAARLERHANKKVPANVLRQVRDWSRWVRLVTSSSVTLLRCPDRDAADRVMAVLKTRSERISETVIAVKYETITSAERHKLKGHGIIVQGEVEALLNRLAVRDES